MINIETVKHGIRLQEPVKDWEVIKLKGGFLYYRQVGSKKGLGFFFYAISGNDPHDCRVICHGVADSYGVKQHHWGDTRYYSAAAWMYPNYELLSDLMKQIRELEGSHCQLVDEG